MEVRLVGGAGDEGAVAGGWGMPDQRGTPPRPTAARWPLVGGMMLAHAHLPLTRENLSYSNSFIILC